MGSVKDLTDPTETVVEQYTYNSFGEMTTPPTTNNPYTYTSREYDAETGIFHYRSRYYDPSIGRFITEDPIGFDGGVNFYAYVSGNPINFIDPLGLAASCTTTGTWYREPTASVSNVRVTGVDLRSRINPGGRIGFGLAAIRVSVTGTVSASIKCTQICIDECGDRTEEDVITGASVSVTIPGAIGIGITSPWFNVFWNWPATARGAARGIARAENFNDAVLSAGRNDIIPSTICDLLMGN